MTNTDQLEDLASKFSVKCSDVNFSADGTLVVVDPDVSIYGLLGYIPRDELVEILASFDPPKEFETPKERESRYRHEISARKAARNRSEPVELYRPWKSAMEGVTYRVEENTGKLHLHLIKVNPSQKVNPSDPADPATWARFFNRPDETVLNNELIMTPPGAPPETPAERDWRYRHESRARQVVRDSFSSGTAPTPAAPPAPTEKKPFPDNALKPTPMDRDRIGNLMRKIS